MCNFERATGAVKMKGEIGVNSSVARKRKKFASEKLNMLH